MTDPETPDALPVDLTGLPMQPTGSGVADLEVAYERMKLAGDEDADAPPIVTAEPVAGDDPLGGNGEGGG